MARNRQTYAERKAAVQRITGDESMTPGRYTRLRARIGVARGVQGIPLGPATREHTTGSDAFAAWGITEREFRRMRYEDAQYSGLFWADRSNRKLWDMYSNKRVAPEKRQGIRTAISANQFNYERSYGTSYDAVGYVVTYYRANVDPKTNWEAYRNYGTQEAVDAQRDYLVNFAENIDRDTDAFIGDSHLMDYDEFETRYGIHNYQ